MFFTVPKTAFLAYLLHVSAGFPFGFQLFPDFERFFYFAKLCVLCNLLHPYVHTPWVGTRSGELLKIEFTPPYGWPGRRRQILELELLLEKGGGKHQSGWDSLFAVFISCFAGKELES